jgi:hypothetical protein
MLLIYKSQFERGGYLRPEDPLIKIRCTLSAVKSQEAKTETGGVLTSVPFFANYLQRPTPSATAWPSSLKGGLKIRIIKSHTQHTLLREKEYHIIPH